MKLKDTIAYFFRTYFFWVLLFVVARFAFALYEYEQTLQYSGLEVLKSFLYGFRHDLSAAGYMLMLNGVLYSIYFASGWKILKSIVRGVNSLLIVVCGGVVFTDAELYRNWGSHLDSTPLLYLKTPAEAMASVTPSMAFFVALLFLLFSIGGIFTYSKYIFPKLPQSEGKHWIPALVSILLAGSMILPVRGGVGIAPMNTGTVYFHKELYPNHLAVNACWNFIYSLSKIGKMAPPYKFMEDKEALSLQKELLDSDVENVSVLNSKRPNIIIILMESFTAKAVGALGSPIDYTPNLSSIAKQGILFNNILATSDRSDKGIVGVVSGFPAQPRSSIMKYPQKSQHLPYLTKELKAMGYSTSYYYGGETDFANMNSYLTNAEFDEVVDMHQFSSEHYNSKWGVHDHILLDRFMNDLNKESLDKPFFKMLFTLSSHEPFEVPMETMVEGNDEENLFLNSIMYADKSIGAFFEEAKKQPWYDNTMFVFVADHGHRLPGNDNAQSIDKYRIPLVFAGGAVSVSDSIVTKRGGNTDVAATILKQLGGDCTKFKYSKDLLSEGSKSFSFFDYNNGFGFITDSTQHIVSLESLQTAYKQSQKEKYPYGEAFLQNLWNDFLRF